MEQEYNDSRKGSSGNSSKTLMILAIILGIAAIVLVILLLQTRSNLKSLLAEKEEQRVELQTELDSLLVEHERVKQVYGQLSDSLSVKDSVIRANAVEIKRLLDTEWEYYKVKKKLSQLQLIAQGYVRQMDSLYRVNTALTEENIAIRKDLKDLRQEKEEIENLWCEGDPEDPDGRMGAAWLYDYSDWEVEDDYVEIYGPFTVDIVDEDEYNVVIEENIKLENRPKIDPNSAWPFK